MLPDLPKLKARLHDMMLDEYQRNVEAQVPLYVMGRHHILHEGAKYTYSTVQGEVHDGTPQLIESSAFLISPDEVPLLGLEQIREKMKRPTSEMAKRMNERALEMIEHAVQRAGHAVDGQGRPFSQDTLFEALEAVDMDFDDEGCAGVPTLLAGPELAGLIQRKIDDWAKDREFRARWDQLIARKQEEWHDRESNRALVD